MDPVAFKFGGFAVYWYGIFVAVGFFAGLWTASRRCILDNIDGKVISDLGVWIIIAAMLGARVLYVVSYWEDQYAGKAFWNVLDFRAGGLVFYGGFIGAALAVILYTRLYGKQPLWKIADAFAPSIPLGHALGRIGCLMYGCCYGTACDLPWAIKFPAGSLAYDALGQALDNAAHSVDLHPTQIYAALLNLALYGGLAWLYRRKRFNGQVFSVYIVGYSINRFIVEFFRGDYSAGELWLGWIKPGQQLSLMLLPIGIILFFFFYLRQTKSEN